MPRMYVPEWIKCPCCGEPTRITQENIIFRHTKVIDLPYLSEWTRLRDIMEECPGSRKEYKQNESS